MCVCVHVVCMFVRTYVEVVTGTEQLRERKDRPCVIHTPNNNKSREPSIRRGPWRRPSRSFFSLIVH